MVFRVAEREEVVAEEGPDGHDSKTMVRYAGKAAAIVTTCATAMAIM